MTTPPAPRTPPASANLKAPPTKMPEAEIQAALLGVPEWSELNGAIQRTFQFANFIDAMQFVVGVADEAEDANHHPDILIRYNKVTLTLSTHDSGGITAKDFELAKVIDGLTAIPGLSLSVKPQAAVGTPTAPAPKPRAKKAK